MHGGVIGVHPSICGLWLLYLCDFRFAEYNNLLQSLFCMGLKGNTFPFIKQFIAICLLFKLRLFIMSTLVIPLIKLIHNKWSMNQTCIDIRDNYSQRRIRSWFFNARMAKRINRNIYNRKRYGCQVKTFMVEGFNHIIWVNPMWLNNGKTTLRINNKSYSYKCTSISQGEIIRNRMISTYDDKFYFNIKYV
jgi:hypothetical protein